MKKGILFDLDGTLWDSSKEVSDSWILALKDFPEFSNLISVQAIQSVMGKPMNEIKDILFPNASKELRDKLMKHCIAVENEYIKTHGGHLVEGLESTLIDLKKEYRLYIVSNCQVGYIEAFLQYHRLEEYFDDYESYGGTGLTKGENIRLVVKRNDLEWAVYIGDTQGDYEAANMAGLPFIHTRTGYGRIAAEVLTIEKIAELPIVLEKMKV